MADESEVAALAERLQAFLDSAMHVVRGYAAAVRAYVTDHSTPVQLDRGHHHRISATAQACPTFEQLGKFIALTVPRYRPAPDDTIDIGKKRIRFRSPESQAAAEVAAFLRRAGIYRSLVEGTPLDAEALARTFLEDAAREQVRVRHLVPVDGLHLRDGTSIDFGAGRLIRLSRAEWDDFFELDLYYAPNTAVLSKVGVLEILEENQDRRGLAVYLGPPTARVARIADPWITYLCLFGQKAVRPCALYSKDDTKLTDHAVTLVHLVEPSSEPHYFDPEQEPDYSPIYKLDVDEPDKLRDFIVEMESGRSRATAAGPRLGTALHWFRRTTDHLFAADEYGLSLPAEAYEDFLSDTFTAFEAVLLARDERNKGEHISQRAAALISSTDEESPNIQERLKQAYKLRNDIVHGDMRPPRSELTALADFLGTALRQTVVAALRLGDQSPLRDAVKDDDVRQANRLLVPRY